MASNIIKGSALKSFKRTYSEVAATTQEKVGPFTQEFQTQPLKNGALVASKVDDSLLARYSIFAKCGPRYESHDNIGLSHMTRICAGMATNNFSALHFMRSFQQMGSPLSIIQGREYTCYSFVSASDYMEEGFNLLNDMVLHPSYKHWEVTHQKPRIVAELANLTHETNAIEMLHSAAFNGVGLGRSLFMPDHLVGKINDKKIREFVSSTHSSSQMAFTAFGLELGYVFRTIRELQIPQSTESTNLEISHGGYFGGEERKEVGGSKTVVAVAGKGPKSGSPESAALEVARFILGAGQRIDYSQNSSGKLDKFVKEKRSMKGEAVALNATYSDQSLFGFIVAEEPQNAGEVVSAALNGIKSLKVTEAEVAKGKKAAKAAVYETFQNGNSHIATLGLSLLQSGSVPTLEGNLKLVDDVTMAKVQQALDGVFKGKLSMSAYGNLSTVPYLSQL